MSKVEKPIAKFDNDKQSTMDALRAARKSLRTALNASPFDEEAVRKAYSPVAALRGEQLVMIAKIRAEIRSVLNPDQLAKLDALKAQRAEKMKDRVRAWLQGEDN